MTLHLSFDGVDDGLVTPVIMIDKIELEFLVGVTQFDAYNVLIRILPDFAVLGYKENEKLRFEKNVTKYLIDGVEFDGRGQFVNLKNIQKSKKHNLIINLLEKMNEKIYVFNDDKSWSRMNGLLYYAKFYNNNKLVAHYDMSKGNVLDQSGNSNHATLTGGTWETDTPGGGTQINTAVNTRQNIYKAISQEIHTKQEIYKPSNTTICTMQHIYKQLQLDIHTNTDIFKQNIVPLKTLQEIYNQKELQLMTIQQIYNKDNQIIGVVRLNGNVNRTIPNQNIMMHAGNTRIIEITIDDITDYTDLKITWGMGNGSTVALLKSLENGIDLTDGKIRIKLDSDDTKGLLETYRHECVLTDLAGNISTVLTGLIIIKNGILR